MTTADKRLPKHRQIEENGPFLLVVSNKPVPTDC